jgi:hypothetical protein
MCFTREGSGSIKWRHSGARLARQKRGQCYKTFYLGNLLPFHGNNIIICYKTNYFGNYRVIAVNYCSILTLEEEGLNYRGNLPQYCFITLAPVVLHTPGTPPVQKCKQSRISNVSLYKHCSKCRKPLECYDATTLSIMTLSVLTLSIKIFSIATLSITTLSIIVQNVAFWMTVKNEFPAKCPSAECQ